MYDITTARNRVSELAKLYVAEKSDKYMLTTANHYVSLASGEFGFYGAALFAEKVWDMTDDRLRIWAALSAVSSVGYNLDFKRETDPPR